MVIFMHWNPVRSESFGSMKLDLAQNEKGFSLRRREMGSMFFLDHMMGISRPSKPRRESSYGKMKMLIGSDLLHVLSVKLTRYVSGWNMLAESINEDILSLMLTLEKCSGR